MQKLRYREIGMERMRFSMVDGSTSATSTLPDAWLSHLRRRGSKVPLEGRRRGRAAGEHRDQKECRDGAREACDRRRDQAAPTGGGEAII